MKYQKINHLLIKNKYEFFLVALILHLYIGIFLRDLNFYTSYVWFINMIIIGIASTGIFSNRGKSKKIIKNLLTFLVILIPVLVQFFKNYKIAFLITSFIYFIFFAFIFLEVLRFLIKPSYINKDIISASACGYFLIIEMMVFIIQFFYYQDMSTLKGINYTNAASTYIDLVYFSSITITSIGFGDIVPVAPFLKLIVAFFGICGQFYSVVLVGILISKFSSRSQNNSLSEKSKN